MAISPLEGRYLEKMGIPSRYLSENALLAAKIRVELDWLLHLTVEYQGGPYKFLSLEDYNRVRNLRCEPMHWVSVTRIREIEAECGCVSRHFQK